MMDYVGKHCSYKLPHTDQARNLLCSEPALIGWHVCHTSLGGDGALGIPHAVPVLVAHVIVVFL
jgi:hypothetical protein